MVAGKAASGKGEPKQFIVECEGCSFERPAEGREEATRIGTDHRRATGHELVAVEAPPAMDSN